MTTRQSFPHRGVLAWRFAANVFVGSTIVWYTLRLLSDTNPIWAVASMLASADSQVDIATNMFKSRMVNVLVGGIVGLIFLVVGGSNEWILPVALAVTVLISSYLVRIQTMWRQAPITAAVVIAAGLMHHSQQSGIEFGLHRVAEVLFGSLVGVLVSWVMAKFWRPIATDSPGDHNS